jgi:hypothetical protein
MVCISPLTCLAFAKFLQSRASLTRATKLVPSIEERSALAPTKPRWRAISKRPRPDEPAEEPPAKAPRFFDFVSGAQVESFDIEASASRLVQHLNETRIKIEEMKKKRADLQEQVDVAKTFSDGAFVPLYAYPTRRLETLRAMAASQNNDDGDTIQVGGDDIRIFLEQERQLQKLANDLVIARSTMGFKVQHTCDETLKNLDAALNSLIQKEQDLSKKVNLIHDALLPFAKE